MRSGLFLLLIPEDSALNISKAASNSKNKKDDSSKSNGKSRPYSMKHKGNKIIVCQRNESAKKKSSDVMENRVKTEAKEELEQGEYEKILWSNNNFD